MLLHELAHLIEQGHGPAFWRLLEAYPRTERARGYLEGFAAAGRLDPGDTPDDAPEDAGDGVEDSGDGVEEGVEEGVSEDVEEDVGRAAPAPVAQTEPAS